MGGERVRVAIARLAGARDLPLPRRATPGSAGYDLCAAVDGELVLAPGARALVPTGLALAVPEGYEAQVRPRSGLALQHAITLPNSPATIDPGYRGEIKVILLNLGRQSYAVRQGDRIAQLVIARYEPVEWEEGELSDSRRGEGGFGSSGR